MISSLQIFERIFCVVFCFFTNTLTPILSMHLYCFFFICNYSASSNAKYIYICIDIYIYMSIFAHLLSYNQNIRLPVAELWRWYLLSVSSFCRLPYQFLLSLVTLSSDVLSCKFQVTYIICCGHEQSLHCVFVWIYVFSSLKMFLLAFFQAGNQQILTYIDWLKH